MENKTKKVAVGLSGGVDSAVTAYLLKQQGYEVVGFFMRNWDSTVNMELNNILTEDEICQQEEDYKDAQAVAKHLGIEINRVDFVKEYWDNVFSVFLNDIKLGNTPNPDILCNRHVKFKAFTNYIFQNYPDIDLVATGHYAKVIEKDNNHYLAVAKDDWKDQTYFLAEIDRKILPKIIFPLGEYNKSEIREIAKKANIPVADKKDSVGICFIGKRNFPEFISNYLEDNPGDIVDINTKEVVGKHRGVLFYTIGQRKGLNLGGMSEPYFVAKKDVESNILYVSNGSDEILFTDEVSSKNFNYLVDINEVEGDVSIKTRHSNIVYEGKVIKNDNGNVVVKTNEKIKAVTPGQELVVYKDNICLGGGVII